MSIFIHNPFSPDFRQTFPACPSSEEETGFEVDGAVDFFIYYSNLHFSEI